MKDFLSRLRSGIPAAVAPAPAPASQVDPSFTLFDLLVREIRRNPTSNTCPAIWFPSSVQIVNASYVEVATPPIVVARRLATLSYIGSPELVDDSDTTGAGTSVTLNLQNPTASTTASRTGIELQRIGAICIEVGLNEAPAGQGQLVATMYDADGVAVTQDITFRYPASGVLGKTLNIVLLPGRSIRGPYQHTLATVGLADPTGTVAAARDIALAFTGLPNNTQVNATAVNGNHADALRLAALFGSADAAALAVAAGVA